MEQSFKVIGKSIYFPEQGILAIGDLHLGYEEMLKSQGLIFPLNQLEENKKEISKIMDKLKKQGHKLRKIVLLGDIKHHFRFDIGEKMSVKYFLNFLTKYVSNQNIIFIKGNHDKIELEKKKYREYFVSDGIAFTHGDKIYERIFEEDIHTVVTSHIHPAVMIKDPNGVKREKFKCFLIGNYKTKRFIIVPSFLPMVEGSEINEYESSSRWEQIIPNKKLEKFDTLVVGENRIYNFGEYGKLN